MKYQPFVCASVCSALLAASAAVSGVVADDKSAAAGYGALAKGEPKIAATAFTKAIASGTLTPAETVNARLNRALAYQMAERYEDAIADYTTALKAQSLDAKVRAIALYNRGIAQRKAGRPVSAIEDYTNALFNDATFAEAYYSRANVLRASGQFLSALSDYEKALKHGHPQPHLPLFGQALSHEALGALDKAKAALIKVLKYTPAFAPAKTRLAKLNAVKTQERIAQTPAPLPAVKAPTSRAVVTTAISRDEPGVVVRKANLPAPVSPPDHFMKTQPAIEPAAANLSQDPSPSQTTAGRLTGWTIQLTSQRKEQGAWHYWQKLQTRHGKILNDQEALVVSADLGSRGTFYRLRLNNMDSRKAAAQLCKKLKRRGTTCFVVHASS